MAEKYWLESDNALGAQKGDVDDGFAITAAMHLNLTRILTTYGNCSEDRSFIDTQRLLQALSCSVELSHGARFPDDQPKVMSPTREERITFLALGPLTTLAHLLANQNERVFEKVVVVGGRPFARGFLYPYWPHEFNFAKDPIATNTVFSSPEELFVVDLKHAGQLQLSFSEWLKLPNRSFPFKTHSLRWLIRNSLLKSKAHLVLWDVVAVATQLWPECFDWQLRKIKCLENGRLIAKDGNRDVWMISMFDRTLILKRFLELLPGEND